MLLVLFLPATFAQEATQTILPDGAVKRFGKGFMRAVLYTPDGAYLAVGGSAGIWFYDSTTYREVAWIPVHIGRDSSVVFSPDGKTLSSVVPGNTVRLWDVKTGEQKGTLDGHLSLISTDGVFSPDGVTLATGSRVQTVRLWDIKTGEQKGTLTGHTDWVISLAFSPDGMTLASGSRDRYGAVVGCQNR